MCVIVYNRKFSKSIFENRKYMCTSFVHICTCEFYIQKMILASYILLSLSKRTIMHFPKSEGLAFLMLSIIELSSIQHIGTKILHN